MSSSAGPGATPAEDSGPSAAEPGTPDGAGGGFASTALGLWNRKRDLAVVQRHLKLAEEGCGSTRVFDLGGAHIATGYCRLLLGDHGPYLEFLPHHVHLDAFERAAAKGDGRFYNELYTPAGCKLYEQLATVAAQPNPPRTGHFFACNNRPEGYADYRVGRFYVGCEQVAVEHRRMEEDGSEGALEMRRIPDVRRGTVRWFKSKLGFGFITPEGYDAIEDNDVFVPAVGIVSESSYKTLQVGEHVEYRIITNSKGSSIATDVTGPGGSFVRGLQPKATRPGQAEDETAWAAMGSAERMERKRADAVAVARRLATRLREGWMERTKKGGEGWGGVPSWVAAIQRGSVVCPVASPVPAAQGHGGAAGLAGVWDVYDGATAEATAGAARDFASTVPDKGGLAAALDVVAFLVLQDLPPSPPGDGHLVVGITGASCCGVAGGAGLAIAHMLAAGHPCAQWALGGAGQVRVVAVEPAGMEGAAAGGGAAEAASLENGAKDHLSVYDGTLEEYLEETEGGPAAPSAFVLARPSLRGRMHARQIAAVRHAPSVLRVVLLTTDPEAAVRDALSLAGTSIETRGTPPFAPVDIIPICGGEGRPLVLFAAVLARGAGVEGDAAASEYCWRCGDRGHLKPNCHRRGGASAAAAPA